MKKIFFAFALIAFSGCAFAQQEYPRDILLSWTNADQYVDSTLIEPGDLTGVKMDCYRQNDTVPVFSAIVPVTGEGLAQSEIFIDAIPQPGTYRCEGFSIVIGDIYSDASSPTFKKFVGKPKSFTNFTFD